MKSRFDKFSKATKIEVLLRGIVSAMSTQVSTCPPRDGMKNFLAHARASFVRIRKSDFDLIMNKTVAELIQEFADALPEHKKYLDARFSDRKETKE